MTQSVPDRVRNVLSAVLGVPADSIGEFASPQTLEAWDSLKHMNLVLALEEEFGVSFSDEQMLEMLNFKLIVATVQEILGA
ncbi:MAG: acyl carrier protein [Nitrospinae bacterium]|nr:acyl carrier protein [Nitrospinota bacterium]